MHWASLRRYTAGCAAALALFAGATSGQVVPLPIPPNPVAPAGKPKLKWADICIFTVADGRLVLRCDITLDMLRLLDGSDLELDGLPGTTSLTIISKRYEVRNEQKIGNDDLVLSVYSIRSGLTVSSERTHDGKTIRTSFDQSSNDYRRGGRGDGDVRLTVWGGGNGDGVVVEATDFAALRKNHPHEANRYLRPLFRQLKADLFQVDVRAARQVLFTLADEPTPTTLPATRPGELSPSTAPATQATSSPNLIFPQLPTSAPSTRPADVVIRPEVREAVLACLADVNSSDFRKRQQAVDRLSRLGPPAVAVLQQMDRKRLSAQQALVMDLLEASSTPLPAEEAQKLRADPHFLLDCLYLPESPVRAAAVEQLVRLGKASPKTFEKALSLDPKQAYEDLLPVIEKLREELVPAK